ncbi:maleylpyruvate isomerase family mycothiol-dependent enzyme [Mycolicibacterium komossense]|uniref:Maleylpyruvate isomerase family mycothiol-dependent enzyme n=1 Tax=Mycolicibacterium komossense TaxID=1779 RepID=A0ABT3CFJ5_9MYCO|nr:maleylpyruvate isomerase family mycothiol-dependent enzyme [Mycolicibacterium komossense]MCV7228217.1 maleylpyruvate isomerase family mycothiol-dependent enzyme [Mycolicibacterium komossense]
MSRTADMLRDNDTRLTEFLASLTDDEWTQPSLCTAWTNHDVLAHLVIGYSASLSSIVASTLRHRGSFDQANTDMAHALATQRKPADLLHDLTALTRQARGVGRVFPRRLLLGDHIIHELDITYALGRDCTIPAASVAAVLDTEVRIPNPFVPAAIRARGLNLITTDSTWARRSDGPTVIGQAAHLASVLAGRPWALRQLTGDGAAVLASRLEPPRKP